MKPRDLSPTRPQMKLAAPNSPARRGSRSTGLLEPYHDIASDFFSLGKGPDLDDIFLTASRDGDFERIFELLRRRNEAIINIDARDRVTGNTPLIWAAKRGHGKIVQQLLKHGADVTLRNFEGQTAVEVASPAIRNQLLESVDKGGPHRNLLQASWQGNAKLLKKILSEARVDINCRNGDGLTPLLLVTRDVQLFEKLRSRGRGFEPQQVVSELLTSRADPNAVDEEGRTPLHYVSTSKTYQGSDIVKMLLRDGSDVHTRDKRCIMPIHCASQTGNVDVVVALLDGGSDANARGFAGSTPLHISAINGHDNVVNKLLMRGADVTVVDDSGLTPVDVAKTKKVKQTLKQAWAEATQDRLKENLGPVRPPSSSSRRSFDGATAAPPPAKSPKRGGQVIFDLNQSRAYMFSSPTPSEQLGMRTLSPLSPLTTSHIDLTLPTTSSSSLDALTPRRAAVTLLQKQLTDAEKVRKAENERMRDVISANSVSRSRTPSAKTPRGISGQRLSPLRNASPAKTSRREIKFSPGTKDHDGGKYGSTYRRKSTGETPLLQRECSIPVTMLGFDLDDHIQDSRARHPSKGPAGQVLTKKGNMCRSFSCDSSVDPGDESYLRAHSSSRTSLATNPDWEDSDSASRSGSARTPSASSLNRLTTIEERSATSETRPLILDLDQMRLTNVNNSPIFGDGAISHHPNSQHLLPPTPVYMQNGDHNYGYRDMDYADYSSSSKENSPRTDDELENAVQSAGDRAYCGEVQLAVSNVDELVRSKSVLNQGQFNIENTRVQQSDDSGCPEEISSSNRSSVNSTDGTIPTDTHQESQGKPAKGLPTQTCSVSRVGVKNSQSNVESDPREKLRIAAKENAAKKHPVKTAAEPCQFSQAKDLKGCVTVHSNVLQCKTDIPAQSKCSPMNNKTVVPGAADNHTKPDVSAQQGSAPAAEPAPCPPDNTCTSQANSQKGLLKIKLVPNKTPEQRAPPCRPPPPGSTGKGESKITVRKSSEGSVVPERTTATKQAPARPSVPPRSRTPSASSVSSSGSSGKEGPVRPPPPKRPASPVKQTSVSVNKKGTPSLKPSAAENKKAATQTTTFRLSSYLQQKEEIESYNLANDKASQNDEKSDSGTSKGIMPATVKTSPAIILTSQSQTQFDLSAIPDVLTTQAPNDEENQNEIVQNTAPEVKHIEVKEALPRDVSQNTSTKDQAVDRSLGGSISEVKLNEKPIQNDHDGPVIWDPFETIRAKQKPNVENNAGRPKTSRTAKSATKRKPFDRQQSVMSKAPVSKSRDAKSQDSKKGRPKSPRPKSPRSRSPRSINNNKKNTKKKIKGKKSSNKVEVLMPDHPELNNVAYIGGVGWQVKTEYNEDEPVHQVRFGKSPLDYDTDEEDSTPRLTVVPNYMKERPSLSDIVIDNIDDPHYNQYLQLPGQLAYCDSDTGDSSEDDLSYLLPDAEETVNEVVFDHLTPRIVNGILIDVPKNQMLSPRNIPLKPEMEEHVPEDKVVSGEKDESAGNPEENSGVREDKKEEAEDKEEVFEDPPSLKPFDKKGVMNWKKKTPGSADVLTTQNVKRTTKLNSTTSPKSASQNTPKQTPKSTPAATPKQTPNATPKQTPSATPKQTPGNTPKTTPTASPKKTQKSATQGATPQPPPRKPKTNKTTTAASTTEKPIPPKRNTSKNQQKLASKKEDTSKNATINEQLPEEKKEKVEKSNKKTMTASVDVQQVQQVPETVPKSEQDNERTQTSKGEEEPNKLKKMLSKDEDTEIDAMIDEILKSTPHPSLSLSLKSQKSDRPERTHEELMKLSIDARNRLENELSKSQNGKLFCEVPVQQMINPEADLKNKIESQEPEVQISQKEQHELEKFMNSLRKMELSISLPNSDENHNHNEDQPNTKSGAKPPLPPRPTTNSYSRTSSYGQEKSPRFIRKLDSWKDAYGKPVVPVALVRDDSEEDDDSIAESDFHSDALSVVSNFSDRDDSIIPKDGRVVTSRIGRRSAAGRSSAMSSHESSTEDVETIQWKRGNMLGKGAFGKVWCGLTNLGELIAVKQIELNINDMEQAELEYEKIQDEVELLKTLKHPNIVGYLGTSLEDNIVSIFMQFIPGGSIANLLARFGALEEEVFCHYTKQILEGVAYLHQNNVIHRDIKGGNVMLMQNAVIKLIDFGCAKRLCLNINSLNNSNKGLLKSMRGTPYWMAPEVVRETGYGTKSDIWSIGCTVFEMATKKPPWADVPPMAAIFAIGTEKETPQLPDKFSANARDFVSQCMTRDQNQRPSARELLTHAFLTRRKKKK